MRYQMLYERLNKSTSIKLRGHVAATVYRVQTSSRRRWPRHFIFAPQYMSTTTSSLSDTEKQPRHANLRSQLPLADIISPTSHAGAINSSSAGLSNIEGNKQERTSSSSSGSSKKSRSLRPYIYGSIFFAVGSLTGNLICSLVIPRDSPVPGSPEDLLMIKYLHEQAEKLPLVSQLSSDALWSPAEMNAGQNKEEETTEMGSEPDPGKAVEEEINEIRRRRLTIGPLGGSRALGGYQKMFRHTETGEIVKIFWVGPRISGWPGVAHGGILATILDETLGRCAMGFLEGHTGVTANLQVNYLKPVLTNGFYVIRATVLDDQDGGNNENKNFGDRPQKRKQWVTGTLENIAGEPCVEAKALFVVPKKYKLKILNP